MSQNSKRPWRGGYGRGQWRGGSNWRGGNNWRGRGSGGQYFSGHNRGAQNNSRRGNGDLNLMNDPQVQKPKRKQMQTQLEIQSPYKGWKMYFPNEMYNDHSDTVRRVQVFEKYIISWSPQFKWNEIEEKGSFSLEFKDLKTDKVICEGIEELESKLKDMPENVLACLGLAMHQIISSERLKEAKKAAEEDGEPIGNISYDVGFIQARISNFGTPVPLKNMKANYYGKFVSIRGTVVRVGNIKPLCTKLAFECNTCGYLQVLVFPDGKFAIPTLCPAEGCRSKSFTPKRSCRETQTIDWQTIRVQEIMSDGSKETGRIPRTIDCELTQDLVDSCVPGDIVTISGMIKVNSLEEGKSRNKDKCMFLLYLHANSVYNTKGSKSGDNAGLAMDFTLKELYAIEEIQSDENTFKLLVQSLCPSIYGHELVKAGLMLGLFGGTQKYTNDKNRIPVRGDPHILVVGDPGLGKSQMLQAASAIAPRSVYVCGNTTTTSGLTVTLSKEGGSGDYALEAGALVLADQGCCCIDEFDKMGTQHQALLEAMEQQSISMAKAGIVCSLPARTSIIAAANPVGGHYNKSKTVSENLKMGSALLSRFDLVFILLDKPDEEMDSVLSDHVMALHSGKNRSILSVTVKKNSGDHANDSILLEEGNRPLGDRLKLSKHEPLDPIPPQLLRKYIGYARKYVHPKIGKDAAKVLQDFYLELRKQHQTQDSTPITTRQLESLIRLTEARARIDLREECSKEDAEDVIEIMKYSMVDTYTDQFGWLDFKRSQHGSGMSGRAQPKKFIAALQRISNQTYNSIFTIQQMRQIAKEIGLQIMDFENFVSSLNNQGFLLKKGPKVFQLQTTDY